jgi:DNA-binding Lrp family transcriptional regulator
MFSSMETLLRLLQQDANTSREDLARLLNLSVEETNARIAALEKEGVIRGYQAIVDRERLDKNTVTAFIEVRITPERGGGFDRIAHRIAKFDQVVSCYLISGGYDLLVVVEGGSLREVASFVSEKLSTIESVISTATHFRLKTYKENGALFTSDLPEDRLPVSP